MIDLTPLDIRKKRGDFKKLLRGYDPQEVDTFLELAAERLEEVARDNTHLRDRVNSLQELSDSQTGREKAVQEALVMAQELRSEMKLAAQREADMILGEAKAEARSLLAEADAELRSRLRDGERRVDVGRDALQEMERRRTRFLQGFRQLLERELEDLEVEEGKVPLEDRPIDMDLGRGKAAEAMPWDEDPTSESDALDPPALDMSVDDLAAGYRGEVEDLFSPPKEPEDEDSRWG